MHKNRAKENENGEEAKWEIKLQKKNNLLIKLIKIKFNDLLKPNEEAEQNREIKYVLLLAEFFFHGHVDFVDLFKE